MFLLNLSIFVCLVFQTLANPNFYEEGCGLTYNEVVPNLKPHINGGQEVEISDWPWVVAIHVEGRKICTGSIISNRYILTAAHCYIHPKLRHTGDDEPYFSIHAGSKYADEGEVIGVKNITTYDSYISEEIPNEIAILELDRPLNFNENITKVCLAKYFIEIPEDNAFLAGFGSDWHKPDDNVVLQDVMINFRQENYCKSASAQWGYNSSNYICAGARNKGSAPGDSGAPLMIKRRNKTRMAWFEVGIVAGGGYLPKNPNKANEKWSETLFTRVSAYCDWIQNVTNGEASCENHLY